MQEELLRKLQFIREEIRFEHLQLNTRLSWFIGAQSFLFVAYVRGALPLGQSGPRPDAFSWFPLIVVPLFGFFVSTIVLVAIFGTGKRVLTQRLILYADRKPYVAKSSSNPLGVGSEVENPFRELISELRPGPDPVAHNRSIFHASLLPLFCQFVWFRGFVAATFWLVDGGWFDWTIQWLTAAGIAGLMVIIPSIRLVFLCDKVRVRANSSQCENDASRRSSGKAIARICGFLGFLCLVAAFFYPMNQIADLITLARPLYTRLHFESLPAGVAAGLFFGLAFFVTLWKVADREVHRDSDPSSLTTRKERASGYRGLISTTQAVLPARSGSTTAREQA